MTSKCAELGSLFDFIRNGMNIKQDKSGEGIPITRIETISSGEVDLLRVGYAGVESVEAERWLLEPGDILFSHINSVEHVGKCALYDGSPSPLIHGMNLLNLRPNKDTLDPSYFKWVFRSEAFRVKLMPFVNRAVNQASVSIGNLSSIRVQVPTLSEQKRIAAILDQADSLRRLRQRAIDRLNNFGQAIFN
jgi:type I restriction enzyme, S subunit